MDKSILRLGLASGAVLAVIAAACAPGCGGTTSHKVAGKPDASAGEAGEGGTAGNGGTSSSLGGGKNGGSGGVGANAGEAGEVNAGGSANAGDGGAAVEAGASNGGSGGTSGIGGSNAGNGGTGGGDIFTEVDAGSDCIAPTDTTRLSASALGLPTSGLTLWVRADKGIYKTSDQHVCAWEDQSGHDTVLLARASGGRPTWGATSLGNQPAITFIAAEYWLNVDGVLGISPTSPRTFISVIEETNLGARLQALMQGQAGTPGTYIMTDANTYANTGQFEAVYIMNNSYESSLPTSTTPRVHVYTINDMTPGDPILPATGTPAIDYRINGQKLSLPARVNAGLGNGNIEDFSGANFTEVGQGPGIVAEAMIYDRALSDAEKAQVEAVLEARYGIKPVN